MCSSHSLVLPRSDPRFSFLFPSRPDPHPRFVSVRFPARPIKAAAVNGTVSSSEPASFYDLLGIPQSGNMFEIKQAYKQLARKYHPDVSPPDRVEEYTERFIRVHEAYETLSDPRRRAMYDRDMAKGIHFAFSARRRYNRFDEDMEDKTEWRSHWQSQVVELKRRSMHKNSSENMSWGARMRRQRNESS